VKIYCERSRILLSFNLIGGGQRTFCSQTKRLLEHKRDRYSVQPKAPFNSLESDVGWISSKREWNHWPCLSATINSSAVDPYGRARERPRQTTFLAFFVVICARWYILIIDVDRSKTPHDVSPRLVDQRKPAPQHFLTYIKLLPTRICIPYLTPKQIPHKHHGPLLPNIASSRESCCWTICDLSE
jgi:hypothetical protein